MQNDSDELAKPVLVPLDYLLALIADNNEVHAKLSAVTAERDRLQRELARTWQ